MKKVLFTLSVVSLVAFSSCKKAEPVAEVVTETANATTNAVEATTTAVETTGTAATGAVQTLTTAIAGAPTIGNPEATAWVASYGKLAGDIKAAAAAGDKAKLTELMTKIAGEAGKLQALKAKLKPEEFKTLSDWATSLSKASK